MKRKGFFQAALSGLMLAAASSPLEWRLLSWFSLVPLLAALEAPGVRSRRAFGLGALTGLIYFSLYLGWITLYSVRVFLFGLPFQVCFTGLFAALTAHLLRNFKAPLLRSVIPAILWVALEFMYGLTPVGSAAMHLEIFDNASLLQLLPLSGTAPVTFLLLFVNGLIASGLLKRDKLCLFAGQVTAALFLGLFFARQLAPPEDGKALTVAAVQPNFPISDSWREKNLEHIFLTYEQMIGEAARQGARLVVLPQYNLPVDVYREPERIAKISRDNHVYLVMGTYTRDEKGAGQYNIALVFSPEGKIIGEYRAVQPPPFRRIGQIRGRDYAVIDTPVGRLGILLCYDDVNPKVARQLVRKGAQILISMMNNGHFGETAALPLHYSRDLLRAAETRRFVVRCAATGISAVILPDGRPAVRGRMMQKQLLVASVTPLDGETFFVRHGDLLSPLLAVIAGALLLSAKRRSGRFI